MRIHVHLPDGMAADLKNLGRILHLKRSEMIRHAVSNYLDFHRHTIGTRQAHDRHTTGTPDSGPTRIYEFSIENSCTPNGVPAVVGMEFQVADGTMWKLTEEQHQEWRDAYPGRDIDQPLRSARQWIIENYHLKKGRKKDMKRFLGAWLRRHVEQASAKAAPDGPTYARAQRRRSDWPPDEYAQRWHEWTSAEVAKVKAWAKDNNPEYIDLADYYSDAMITVGDRWMSFKEWQQ